MTPEEFEHENVEVPTCPWCGFEDSDLTHYRHITSVICAKCGKVFSFERKKIYTYTTRKIES